MTAPSRASAPNAASAQDAAAVTDREAPGPMPIVAVPTDLESIRYDDHGLVVTVVQDLTSREVLMVAYQDAEALRRTLETGRTWFWSRSRNSYWCKGDTSGDRQWVRAVRYDCDGDALLVEVVQEGRGACHTGERSCFFRALGTA
ncbi:MAG: phosphoribosyl-AMP cyclohydrolase [Acidimicrobiaceae bacterium]|nr:phosphoribosyl-AMP cyclohydrolase [Acidimicrobiaceae bacterium]